MKIYLIGFMGSGKSHVGRQLAQQMKITFIDLDDYLEAQEGRSISHIFTTDGEPVFRQLEQKHIVELSKQPEDMIIATGGGTPCFFDNLEQMKQTGLTIYLKTPVDILVERLGAETEHRPLLAGKSKQELADFITKKLASRSVFYENASVVFDINKMEEEVAKILFRVLLEK